MRERQVKAVEMTPEERAALEACYRMEQRLRAVTLGLVGQFVPLAKAGELMDWLLEDPKLTETRIQVARTVMIQGDCLTDAVALAAWVENG